MPCQEPSSFLPRGDQRIIWASPEDDNRFLPLAYVAQMIMKLRKEVYWEYSIHEGDKVYTELEVTFPTELQRLLWDYIAKYISYIQPVWFCLPCLWLQYQDVSICLWLVYTYCWVLLYFMYTGVIIILIQPCVCCSNPKGYYRLSIYHSRL